VPTTSVAKNRPASPSTTQRKPKAAPNRANKKLAKHHSHRPTLKSVPNDTGVLLGAGNRVAPHVTGPGASPADRLTSSYYANTYAAAVLHDSPAGYWKLHSATDLNDVSGGSTPHNGTALDSSRTTTNDSGVWSGTGSIRRWDNGLLPESTAPNGIEVGTGWFTSTDSWTMEGWVNGSGGCGNAIVRQVDSSGDGRLMSVAEADASGVDTSDDPLSGWHYMVATWNGSQVILYRDGVPLSSRTGTSTWTNPDASLTLADLNPVQDCGVDDVSYSDVALYTTRLSALQVAVHYRAAGGLLPISYAELLGGTNPAEFCNSCFVSHYLEQSGSRPIEAQTGDFYHTFTDISLPGRGPALAVTRTYNSEDPVGSNEFGVGWSWNYGASLSSGSTSRTVTQENGAQVTFTYDGSGWVAPSNVFATLTDNGDGTWTMVRAASDTFKFDSDGRLIAETDRNGHTTTLSWPSSLPGTLTVTDASGTEHLSIALNSDGAATSVSDSAGRTVTYGYDGTTDELISASSLGGGSWSYGYDSTSTNLMTSMTEPSTDGVVRKTVNLYSSSSTSIAGQVVAQWDPVATAQTGWSTSSLSTATQYDFSIPGQTTITDPDGRVEIQRYQDGYMLSDTTGLKRSGSSFDVSNASTTSFVYDPTTSGGSIVTDPNGNTTTNIYDPHGWLASTTDALNNTTTWSDFDAFGNARTETLPQVGTPTSPPDNVITSTFDAHGNLLTRSQVKAASDGTGAVTATTTYTVSSSSATLGDVTAVQDPAGVVTQIAHDANTGQVTSTQVGNLNPTTFTYDAAGNQTSSTSPRGNAGGSVLPRDYRSVANFDLAGNALQTGSADGSTIADDFIRGDSGAGVNGLGSTNTGEAWSVLSGDWGIRSDRAAVTSVTDSSSPVNSNGDALAVLDPAGATGSAIGVSMIVSDPTQTGVGLAFRVEDANNYWSMTQDPSNNHWVVAKTIAGVRTVVASVGTCCNAGDRISIASYASGGLAGNLDGVWWTTTDTTLDSYTKTGLVGRAAGQGSGPATVVTKFGGNATQTFYNAAGQPTTVYTPSEFIALRKTVTTYDADGRPTAVTRPDGTVQRTGHDQAGDMVSQTDGRYTGTVSSSNSTMYTYDNAGRLASEAPPGLSTTTYSYQYNATCSATTQLCTPNSTVAGEKDTVTLPADSSCSSTCSIETDLDVLGRPASITYSGSSTPNVSGIEYDAQGRKTKMTTGSSVARWDYDSLGELTSSSREGTSSTAGPTATYGYDLGGNVTTLGYPNGRTITYNFDTGSTSATGRLTSITEGSATYTPGYDGDSHMTSLAYPNGVTETNTFDHDSNLVGITDANGSTTLASSSYARNQNTTLASNTATGAATSQSWAYDTNARVSSNTIGSSTYGFGYDAADDPTSLGGSAGTAHQMFNAANQICWSKVGLVASTTCGSVPTGATTFSFDARGDRITGGSNNYCYDVAARLTAVYTTGSGHSCTSGTTGSYSYDGDGLRLTKAISGTTANFAWDESGGLPLLLEEGTSLGSGCSTCTTYLYLPDGTPIEQTTNGTASYLQHDAQGSITLITDGTGANAGAYTYTAWGVPTHSGTATCHLQYRGQYTDAESGLQYLRARYYDAASAQMLTRDPMSRATTAPYVYADDNPPNLGDPSGLCVGGIIGKKCSRLTRDLMDVVGLAAGATAAAITIAFLSEDTPAMMGAMLAVTEAVSISIDGIDAIQDCITGDTSASRCRTSVGLLLIDLASAGMATGLARVSDEFLREVGVIWAQMTSLASGVWGLLGDLTGQKPPAQECPGPINRGYPSLPVSGHGMLS
jgi:RHS repeat-associated protein